MGVRSTVTPSLIFFRSGEPAYITRRFDVKPDGMRHGQEDMASLAGRTRHTAGSDFKYEGSYEEIARIIESTVPAYRVELEKLFSLIVFNYLFSNGDAHLKNFSLIDTAYGDYVLSPAYDLICTCLHVEDSYFALKGALFSGDYETESLLAKGFYAYDDIYEFGLWIGLQEKRLAGILHIFRQDHATVHKLIKHSFLRENMKDVYRNYYLERLEMLNCSMAERNRA
ncbi:HipA domain-containing protein [Pontibacter mangrovi]|uniref:HipA domain-containing protein n=1 Tax=Pontibacter mangrovi TaxID=2589816 RepID=A0A501W172_9BACT|nr:HipA domain-containing protein [Pontibacter mangrovi]TPE42472.1 HipA domain-containing protein [Pontibacter mangrovi]